MCARVQSDVLRVLRVLRGPVFQFCTCLWRHVFGVLRVLCVLLGLYVLYALCAHHAFSKAYVPHRGPQKRASGQKRTDGSQRNMANMLTRRQYYLLQRLLPTDVVSLLEDCNGQWAGAWCMGGGACGGESLSPQKGMLAGPLKMFIARKPHPTGIKLYCLGTQHGGTWWTCICTPVYGAGYAATALRQETLMPKTS